MYFFIFVRVFVEDEKLIAEYSPYPRLPWLEEGDESMPMTREIIAENVLQVTFNYAEKSTENDEAVDFLEEFREEENTVLPLAVLMKIEFTDGTQEQWLRRVAGVSKNSTFGYRPKPENNNNDDGNQVNSGSNRSSSVNTGSSRSSGRSSRGGGRGNRGGGRGSGR